MTDAPASRRRRLRLFATPVIIDELADSPELNVELEGAILERLRSDPGLRLSNLGGWQSNHDLTAWSGDAGQRVIRHAAALATSNTAAQGKAGMSWSIDAWPNVSASVASNRSHVHGGSYWSAVYYVAVGEGEGGELMLHDPRMPHCGCTPRTCGLRIPAPKSSRRSSPSRDDDPVPRLAVAQRPAVGRRGIEDLDRDEHSRDLGRSPPRAPALSPNPIPIRTTERCRTEA